MNRFIRIAIILVVVFFVSKHVLRMVKKQDSGGTTSTTRSDNSCVRGAERASEKWGSGLRQFVNPPYDLNAWSSFRSDVESNINAAEIACDCTAESCEKARSAMRDLRALTNDLDSAIRNGSDASGFVERQEAIDNRISEASELARDRD